MLSKLAAAVIAVSLIAGPALAQGGSNTLSARQHTAHVVKHVKHVSHIKHVRHVAHHRHHGKFVKQFKRAVRTNG